VRPQGQNSNAFPRKGFGWLFSSSLILLITIGLTARAASAEVVSVVDEHGHRVFINLEPAKARSAAPAGATVTPVSVKTSGPSDSNGAPASTGEVAALMPPPSPPMGVTTAEDATSGPLTNDRLEQLIKMVSERHNVDPALVRAVIRTESNGDPAAVSNKGAQGLMQLMPTTAAEMGVTNAFNPQENLEGGVRYLRQLLSRYGGDLDKALAAYNAGAGAVDRAKGVPRYRETQEYVKKVTSSYYSGAPARANSAKATESNTNPSHPMYQTVDEQGRIVWVNN
jgi:soluble lytic murein transglycosylase-like protein